MKKTILTFASLMLAAAASAYTFTTPQFWSENFVEMASKGDYVSPETGWTTYGNGAAPAEIDQAYFNPDGSGPYYAIIDQGSQSIAMATTDFPDGTPADQWLITPKVTVPYDCSTLSFQACAYGAGGVLGSPMHDEKHAYRVLVSETGTAKEDFKEISRGTVLEGSSNLITMSEKIVSLNDYKGKDVHIAFVATGLNQGFTGFTDMKWGQYTLYVNSNLTNEIAEVGKAVTIDYNMKLRAPVTCPGMTAVLYINGEKIEEKYYKKAFGSATSTIAVIQRVQFKNVYEAKDDTPISYRIVMTPDFEGAEPSEIVGAIGFQKVKYPNNVVIEEMTGTGCQFCPLGIAALEYYTDIYNKPENPNRVINIAIHNNTFGADPMAAGNERYTTSLAELDGGSGLPAGVFNRQAPRGCGPTKASAVQAQFEKMSDNQAKITSVRMPMGDIMDVAGQTATVEFDVRNGFDSSMRNLSASVVLIENDVQGFNGGYNQNNGLAGLYANGNQVVTAYSTGDGAAYGAVPGMAPYFDKFCAGKEFGTNPIKFDKIAYNEVSRGIFPSFEGQPLSENWESDVPQSFSIDFAIPSTVLKLENTEVVVLIVNNFDKAIVASDIFPASKFTDVSGVEEVNYESAISISNSGNVLRVKAQDGSKVEAYSLDGRKLASYEVVNGQLNVATSWKGVVVVKVTNGSESNAAKLIF